LRGNPEKVILCLRVKRVMRVRDDVVRKGVDTERNVGREECGWHRTRVGRPVVEGVVLFIVRKPCY
jgi:hypothetical protein